MFLTIEYFKPLDFCIYEYEILAVLSRDNMIDYLVCSTCRVNIPDPTLNRL